MRSRLGASSGLEHDGGRRLLDHALASGRALSRARRRCMVARRSCHRGHLCRVGSCGPHLAGRLVAQLVLVFGKTTEVVWTIVTAFMAGLGLGGLVGGLIRPRLWRPLLELRRAGAGGAVHAASRGWVGLSWLPLRRNPGRLPTWHRRRRRPVPGRQQPEATHSRRWRCRSWVSPPAHCSAFIWAWPSALTTWPGR